MIDQQSLRHRVRDVHWIGGPPDAGKSTVAELLGDWFEIPIYQQDTHEQEHLQRADAERHPLHVAMRERIADQGERGFFQTWVENDPMTLARQARAVWSERIDMVCEDLAAFDPDSPLVAEGPGFFPDVIVPLLSRPNQAIWLIPTEAFKRSAHHSRRKSGWRFTTTDPDRAMAHHIARDLRLAEAYRSEIQAAGLPWIEIDGSIDTEEIARRVASHFEFR